MKLQQILAGALVLACAFIGQVQAADYQFKEGTDYKVIASPIKVKSVKPYVIEYLWLGCPHCQALNPHMMQYEKTHPGVQIVRRPAIGPKRWVLDAHVFYALVNTGHGDLFNDLMTFYTQLREQKHQLPGQDEIDHFLNAHHIEESAFMKAMNNPDTMADLNTALNEERTIGLTAVPTVVVNGKYELQAPTEGGPDILSRYFALIDYLLKQPV